MNKKYRMLGVGSGGAFFLLWGAGLIIAGFLPPISEAMDAQAVAALFQRNSIEIRVGTVIMTVSAALYLPWTMLLSDLIKQIEGKTSMLSGTQLVAGVMSQITYFLPPYFWGVAALRPFRSPEITQALVDTGWLIFITGIGPFILQYAAIAIAIFSDKRAVPAFPRWVGYFQIWLSISFIPAVLPFFITTGLFSWTGVFVWWLPLTLFAVWFVGMLIYARQAVLREPVS